MTTTKTKKTAAKKPTTAEFSAPISEVHLVPLDLIDVHEQIRKEFNQEGLEDLAKDIAARGILQPVLLNPDPNTGRFTLIAGERRLRAVRINGQDAIPALIAKVTEEQAMLMQLAENVHREELSMMDECKAIGKLYEHLGSLKAVAAKVKKSVPWCSKRFAMTHNELHYLARSILEAGHTEDLELLKTASTLFRIVSWMEAQDITNKIVKGEIGRTEIRALLKAKKEEIKKDHEKPVSHAKPKKTTPPPPPEWTFDKAMDDLSYALTFADARQDDELHNYATEDPRNERCKYSENRHR